MFRALLGGPVRKKTKSKRAREAKRHIVREAERKRGRDIIEKQ